MKSRLIQIIFLIFITTTVIAQKPDYVITNKGDTLHCDISIPFFDGIAGKYTVDGTKKSIRLHPEEIMEYYVRRKQTTYRTIYKPDSDDAEFALILEKGKITLFEQVIKNYNGSSSTYWYIAKGTDSVKELKSNSIFSNKSRQGRKDDFADMINDNKVVYDKYIKDNKFTFDQIRMLVHLYNTGELTL